MSVILILGILCIVGAAVLAVIAFLPLGGSHLSEEEAIRTDETDSTPSGQDE